MNLKQTSVLVVALLGLAVYLTLFYATGLPGVPDANGNAMSRGVLLSFLVLRPDDLVRQWFGTPAGLSLADRLPVLAIAGGIVGLATVLGWLLMAVVRADRGLTRVERFVFSAAVGLNAVSTYVLAVGLAGWLDNILVFAVPAALVLVAAGVVWWRRARRSVVEHSRRPKSKRLLYSQPPSPPAPGAQAGEGSHGGSPARRGRASVGPVARSGDRPQRVAPSAEEGEGNDKNDSLSPHWLWLAVPFVLVIVLGGMLPPLEFDVREYHLQVPKEFYQQGRITFLPHNVYGNMAMGTEMLSLLAMILAKGWWLGALAGKAVTATFALLTALGLWAAGRRLVSATAGIVAAVAFLSTAWVVQVSTLGLIEGASACYLFLAVYAALLYSRSGEPWCGGSPGSGRSPDRASGPTEGLRAVSAGSGDPRRTEVTAAGSGDPRRTKAASPTKRDCSRLLLAGYLAGGAVSTKYPAALFVAVPLTLWLVWFHLRSGSSSLWKPLTVLLLALVAGCGLWFGKNAVLADNPTYPLLYEVFGGRTWTPEKNQRWNQAHRPHDFSLRALGQDMARVGLTSPWLSPLLVPLAVLALANRRHRRLALVLAGYFVYVIAVWWLFTHRIDRFWVPAVPILALLAGLGAAWTAARPWRIILAAVLVFGCVANFLVAASPLMGDNRYFVSLERLRDEPLRLDAWQRYYNVHGTRGRLLLVGEAQVFDLQPPLVYNTCFDSCTFEQLVKNHSPEQIRQAFAARDITDVYVSWGEIARYRRPGNYGFTEFVQPEVFQWLVDRSVLEPLPAIAEHPGRGYRVLPAEGP